MLIQIRYSLSYIASMFSEDADIFYVHVIQRHDTIGFVETLLDIEFLGGYLRETYALVHI